MNEKKKRRFKLPILAKTAIMVFVFAIAIVEIAMTYYSVVMSNRNQETAKNFTTSLSATVAETIDAKDYKIVHDKVDEIYKKVPRQDIADSDEVDEAKIEKYLSYYAPLEKDEEFQVSFNRLLTTLRNIEKANADFDVDCVYLAYVATYTDDNGVKQGHVIYLIDSASEGACPPGWIDPVYDRNRPVIDDQTYGFPAVIDSTVYGHLATSGTYIEGTNYGYALVDVSMTAVRARQADSIIRLFVYMLITVNLIAIVALIVVYFIFTRPMKKLTNLATAFNNADPESTHEQFVNLNIKTRDELEDLSIAMKKMEEGVHQRIKELTVMNERLHNSQVQTAKMYALANKDALTGVRSKIAYNSDIEMMNEQIAGRAKPTFGIVMIDLNYLKQTNDEFGHNAGDEAIIRLANTISLTFKHSPIYRVGGDEFVVIVRNDEYEHGEDLVNEFNERINQYVHNESLAPYLRISAAIGFARYNPHTDKTVDDVFDRADHEMYKRKWEMKVND